MKKILSIIMSVSMLLSITAGLNITVFADTPTSGQCGDNAYYEYDTDNKTLTITGHGDINYTIDEPYQYWYTDDGGWSEEVTRYHHYSIFKDLLFEEVIFSGEFTKIGDYVFYECTNLKTIVIPDTVKAIGKYAFKDCNKLESLTLGKGINEVDFSAFENCDNIKSLYYSGELQQWTSIEFNCVYSPEYNFGEIFVPSTNPINNTEYFYINNIQITVLDFTGIESIQPFAFIGYEKLTNINLGNSIKEIGRFAFAYCNGIKTVNIPDNVTTLEGAAFYNCESLEKLVFGKGLVSIDSTGIRYDFWDESTNYGTFAGNNKLNSLTIPDNIIRIAPGSFSSSLKTVYLNGSINVGRYRDEGFGIPISITNLIFTDTTDTISESVLELIRNSNVLEIVIPDTIQYIPDGAFKDSKNLTSITIPKSVTRIEYNAFSGCTNLTIKGYKNSYAETYATLLGIPFEALDDAAGHIHSYTVKTTKATTDKDGKIVTSCSCGDVKSTITIYHPASVTLSANTYTYNGKAKMPTVTVNDSNGNTIADKNYTVTYSNNKYVGKATVKITFKGDYSGKVSKTFNINPKPTKITSLKAKSKGFKVKWSKITSQADGYQIQYSANKNFKSAKTVKVKGNKNTAKTVSKLKGKKYYVRVRTYKKVGKVTYYSAWSKSKSVKISK